MNEWMNKKKKELKQKTSKYHTIDLDSRRTIVKVKIIVL